MLQLCMEHSVGKASLVIYLLCTGQGTFEASDLANLWRSAFPPLFMNCCLFCLVFLVKLLLLCFVRMETQVSTLHTLVPGCDSFLQLLACWIPESSVVLDQTVRF